MGAFFALTTAVVWAGAVIFLKRSGESLPPLSLNFFRVVLSVVLLLPTMAVLGQPLVRAGVPWQDYALLAASGIIGIAFSDTLFHACLNRVGAGVTAIIDCLYAPFVALGAFFVLGERLAPAHFAGMALVVGGILIAGGHGRLPGTTRRELMAGIALGGFAMATVALGVVIAKPVLSRQPVVWSTGVRQIAALAVLLPAVLVSPQRRLHLATLRPGPSWRWTVPGTILGSYLALMLWLAGMKYTSTGVAAILNQTSTIYILLFASLFLRERFTRRRATACGMALAGALLVLLG
jgi:drug/metabolite transporter (DMT)-like permease